MFFKIFSIFYKFICNILKSICIFAAGLGFSTRLRGCQAVMLAAS